ncbi:pyruvate dehydrogenase (acetyl-transferring) E1 component subunit alpha [Effusibacillus dendaii]|uniref:Pyruvate dehydrogenase E1 component subunit alpha n=1 Tax=Effusibacillus dendaii TaxID=2743772 RepID=A0A7I8D5N4_9BACL|nr:pyruvate dehydrogenase (acetyl-transferring) E1 component subunit alpha [Effusibacillus dendaii]BCJ85468.1 pyruvate dehydrogenase E1 component alpha subunit [Effusibacillus dendaii]
MKTYTADFGVSMYQILAEDGSVRGDLPELSDDKLIEFYKWMLLTRLYDQRAFNLQRQGRIGTYAPFSGQEAAQIGSFAALKNTDWLATSYREMAGLIYHGLPMEHALLYSMGHPDGGKMPTNLNVLPVQIIIAGQVLHAVGAGLASKLRGESNIAVTYYGDGASSQGDVHEAMNFAAVYKAPVIFFCQNNHWAISVPVSKQMATPTIAQKAVAYGMEGIRVDGNDVLAVYSAMKYAADRARSGEGPTLIEAVTYRLGSHTTADDPTRYRNETELKEWQEKRDPLIRFRIFLENKGIWNEQQENEWREEAKQKIDAAVEKAESHPKAEPSSFFDHVYADLTGPLAEQKQDFVQRLNQGEGR